MGVRKSAAVRANESSADDAAPAKRAFADRYIGKASLLLLTILFFTLAFAPIRQFYLAWVALVAWLIVVRHCRSPITAALWSWIGGVGFFIANMWWLVFVTGPGMIALMALLGLYWALAGAIIRGARLLEVRTPVQSGLSVLAIAAIWAGLEWFRATWPLGGLAWLFWGHTQSPVVALCQIADFAGVYGISFWGATVNAAIAFYLLNRRVPKASFAGFGVALAVTIFVIGYGLVRLLQETTTPGPTVLVVQPNYPQSNSGAKGASEDEILDFHMRTTEQALKANLGVDLVAWSETMMPPLNPDAAVFFESLQSPSAQTTARRWLETDRQLASLAKQNHVALVVGGRYEARWTITSDDYLIPEDQRNSAYCYTAGGERSFLRYDKIHLVPFGEYLPFRSAFPPLYRLFLSLSPYKRAEDFTLTPGPSDALTVFELKPGWRFVTPICFEDIDGDLVRRMFKPVDGKKRADLIVNLTNDGWFKFNEMPQHLQTATFRSIENRVPTARSVNTGISGFIDSNGRQHDLLGSQVAGASVATLALDSRVTLYSRFGDIFAMACAAIAAGLAIVSLAKWRPGKHKSLATD